MVHNPVIDNKKDKSTIMSIYILKIHIKHIVAKNGTHKIHLLDGLKSLFPHSFCYMPNLVYSFVDMFISNHEYIHMFITL
jgi:hypothetical protein